MQRIARTALLLMIAAAMSLTAAATAVAKPWPGDPVPDAVPVPDVEETVLVTSSPGWQFALVAVVAALLAGAAVYAAGSLRSRAHEDDGGPATGVTVESIA